MQSITMDSIKPKVLTPGMYGIDVEPIPPRNKNNREVHLDYLKHLKESVETLREIVEEARVEKPLDSSLESACLYTKRSQELIEYVIGTCPKDFNKRDKNIASIPLTRKKQVTFKETSGTLNANTQKHVKPQKEHKTNVPVIPSIGVTSSTKASRDSDLLFSLGYIHNIHRRPESPIHVTGDDFPLGNLKFVPKAAKQMKLVIEKSTKPSPIKKVGKGKAPVGGVAFREPTSGVTKSLPVVEGKGKAIRRTPATKDTSTGPSAQPEDGTSSNIVCDTPSPTDAKTGADMDKTNSEGDTEILNIAEEQGEYVTNKVDLEEKTTEIDEGQVGSDPGKPPES
ncbi:hypothetical protein Tco_1445955 [Tanacetum coccineum]